MEAHKRTHTCGELNASHAGQQITLNGWIHRNRNHGGIHFITLRDRYGITQVVIAENAPPEIADIAVQLKYEYCIAVEGVVQKRPDSMINRDMATGEIEVQAAEIIILSKSETLPFMIDEQTEANDDLRLKYRYLDLRSFSMQRNIHLRAEVSRRVRDYLSSQNFLEIETPTMIPSTPEGARDFLIPSRLNPGRFYAMPQSPQLFKQILMVSGFDRYFQLAHCFRDEDLRGDRQPEHTQIDIEMSFVSQEDVFALSEGLMKHLFAHCLGVELPTPFPRLSYEDAMNRYGSDKPDLRFEMPLRDFAAYATGSGFAVFESVLKEGNAVKLLVVPGAADYSRKQITELEETAKTYGARGLAWTKLRENSMEGGIGKFFSGRAAEIAEATGARAGDLLLFVADNWNTACTALGAVRKRLGTDLGLVQTKPPTEAAHLAFAWITDFPLFEYNSEHQRWEATHHMFTMPQEQFLTKLEQDPGAVRGSLYDLVCNGVELASGSIRIHDPEIQQRIFNVVGMDRAEAERRFGFLLEAFRYGAPPHGGIAPGLDRLVTLMAGESSIREVIAFPKNTAGVNPMDNSPSKVDAEQLKELGLSLNISIDDPGN